MDTYQKYFVSQHFGKSLATVELGKTGGSVVLALTRPEPGSVTFTFELGRLAQFVRDADMHAEMAARIAVQQAHKLFVQYGRDAFDDGDLALALETNPWIGDLTDVPYGGATSGYDNVLAGQLSATAAGQLAPRPA